ncbi:MAG TPA: hypothetical protein VFV94_13135 [Polyangiaceae bacterium]|nr:hypothetical protein [Polyangiaceae bacterium]
MSAPAFPADYQRAFVAMRYFLGAREAELAAPLGAAASEAEAVAHRLTLADRQKRAEALAAEIGRVVRALDAGILR